MNKVILTGNLGGDIELRRIKDDKAVAEVNLAVAAGFGAQKKTLWIGLTLWDKQAENAAQYLSKGRKIAIVGRLDQDEWEDKDSGKKRTKTRVVVESWEFADGVREGGQDRQDRQAPERSQQGGHNDGEDIPF